MQPDTPLAAELIRRIHAEGPISVADYMAACLADPQHGYYTRHDPLGAAGDFITAPEISQIFGELIGLWCLSVWLELGSPSHFVLAELGPGRGTLMADALRAASIRPAFAEAADIVFMEMNEALRRAQAEALQSFAPPTWITGVDALPSGPLIVIANEFFDALPIYQYVSTGSGWAERMIGLANDGRLAFGLRPVGPSSPLNGADAPLGSVLESCPSAAVIVTALAERIAGAGGAALIIDYGHARHGLGDTLQAVRAHGYDDPLAHPGAVDLTAHVDFAALSKAAAKGGAAPHPIIDQATFLGRMGIAHRVDALSRGKDAAATAAIAAGAARLTAADQMGQLFKALAFSSPGLTLPAFDS